MDKIESLIELVKKEGSLFARGRFSQEEDTWIKELSQTFELFISPFETIVVYPEENNKLTFKLGDIYGINIDFTKQ